MTIRGHAEIKRQITAETRYRKTRDVHDQLTLCFVTVDFCLESRDTRLQKELIRLVTEAPAPQLTNNVP